MIELENETQPEGYPQGPIPVGDLVVVGADMGTRGDRNSGTVKARVIVRDSTGQEFRFYVTAKASDLKPFYR